MKKLIIIAIIAIVGWQGYAKYQARHHAYDDAPEETATKVRGNSPPSPRATSMSTDFKCDGRTRCSQMNSCEEATFFLNNCPGVKMDGDNDGIPCERQWCK